MENEKNDNNIKQENTIKDEKNKKIENTINFFSYLIPELNEKLNFIENELKKQEFQNNNFKEENNIPNVIKNYINEELINLCKQGEKQNNEEDDKEDKTYFELINKTFSFNFFTIVIINPKEKDFIHHCSPALFGNIKTDGIFTKNFDFEYNKKEIYVAITIFGFNNYL